MGALVFLSSHTKVSLSPQQGDVEIHSLIGFVTTMPSDYPLDLHRQDFEHVMHIVKATTKFAPNVKRSLDVLQELLFCRMGTGVSLVAHEELEPHKHLSGNLWDQRFSFP